MKFIGYMFTVATSLILVATGQVPVANAQESAVDEVITVGTLIKRQPQADRPSPVTILGEAEIGVTGAKSIADLTQTLTINTGTENHPDAFTQNLTTGTSNINLRGLGVQSTLVLLNGRRQVLTAALTNNGSQFVDTASLVPLIAVENLEILKDGASATYGSDAVAGVVNFMTYDDYDGVKINANYQTVDGFDSDEYMLQAMVGRNFDRGNIMGAISYTDRSPLTTGEKRLSRIQDDTSRLGNPGAFFAITDGRLQGRPLIDPGCESVGGIPEVLAPGSALGIPLDIGFCGFDFGEYYNLIAEEERLTGLLQVGYDVSDNVSWTAGFTYADNEAIRGNSPTFPFLQTAVVRPDHPDYDPVLAVLAPNGAVFFGRAIGNGGDVSPNLTTSETWRFSTQLEGTFGGGHDWRLSFTTGQNNYVVRTQDTVTSRFRCALSGTCADNGGPGGFYNPFSSSFRDAPNSPEILDYIIGTQTRDTTSTLYVVEAVISRQFGEGIAAAVGGQFRSEEYDAKFDEISNRDDFGFLIGEQDFDGDQDIIALFAEMIVPLGDRLEAQAALRFEDYGAIGNTIDPKVAILYQPTDTWSLRGSLSTSFRSPTVYQKNGQATVLEQVTDPVIPGTPAFVAGRTTGSADLTPEESTALNLGTTFDSGNGLEINVDYFNFDFQNVIIAENTQAVINAFPQDPDRVVRAGDPMTGTIVRVNKKYVNASSVKTSGVDFDVRYGLETEFGRLVPFVGGTYVLSYDLNDPQAGEVDGAGNRNFENFGTSVPELRLNAGFAWRHGAHEVNAFARHISGYDDDQEVMGEEDGRKVDAHTTFDAQYRLAVGQFIGGLEEGVALTAGVINATDEDPPQVFTNGGF
ncbi:MAG: TonB-dependent receptor, partial [Hyphomonadaceae bacterium]|nr:TonB-dependent receptor [Hyphomonadaceae bacterium]